MLRSASESESPFAQAYDASAATVPSPQYYLDNFYTNGNAHRLEISLHISICNYANISSLLLCLVS